MAGSVTKFPAVTHDYVPTMVDMVGASSDGFPSDGISLWPVIKAINTKADPGPREHPIGFRFKNQGVWIDNDFKMHIQGAQGSGDPARPLVPPYQQVVLFNVASDVFERSSLSDPARERRMRRQFEAWSRRVAGMVPVTSITPTTARTTVTLASQPTTTSTAMQSSAPSTPPTQTTTLTRTTTGPQIALLYMRPFSQTHSSHQWFCRRVGNNGRFRPSFCRECSKVLEQACCSKKAAGKACKKKLFVDDTLCPPSPCPNTVRT